MFGLLMLGSEVNWQQEVKRAPQVASNGQVQPAHATLKLSGRDQIRTGRKFEMSGANGEQIRVRIHTKDHTQDAKTSNAGQGCIVRIEYGKVHLLFEKDTFQASSHTPASNSFWTKKVSGERVNLAHIPFRFNQVDLKRGGASPSPLPVTGQSASSSFNCTVQPGSATSKGLVGPKS